MPEEATEISDKQIIYVRRFDKHLRDELKELITDQLIEEHRRKVNRRASPDGPRVPSVVGHRCPNDIVVWVNLNSRIYHLKP